MKYVCAAIQDFHLNGKCSFYCQYKNVFSFLLMDQTNKEITKIEYFQDYLQFGEFQTSCRLHPAGIIHRWIFIRAFSNLWLSGDKTSEMQNALKKTKKKTAVTYSSEVQSSSQTFWLENLPNSVICTIGSLQRYQGSIVIICAVHLPCYSQENVISTLNEVRRGSAIEQVYLPCIKTPLFRSLQYTPMTLFANIAGMFKVQNWKYWLKIKGNDYEYSSMNRNFIEICNLLHVSNSSVIIQTVQHNLTHISKFE